MVSLSVTTVISGYVNSRSIFSVYAMEGMNYGQPTSHIVHIHFPRCLEITRLHQHRLGPIPSRMVASHVTGLVAITYTKRAITGICLVSAESMASKCPGSEYFCAKASVISIFSIISGDISRVSSFGLSRPRRTSMLRHAILQAFIAIFPHSARDISSGTHRAMWNFIFVFVAPAVFMNSNERGSFSTFSAAPYAVMLPGCRFKPCASPLLSAITLPFFIPNKHSGLPDSSLFPVC